MSITLPVLPLKNTVIFPRLAVPLAVGRPASIAAVEAASKDGDARLLCLAQREGDHEHPGHDDLYGVGTVVVIRRVERGDGGMQVLVQGEERALVQTLRDGEKHLEADVEILPMPGGGGPAIDALIRENHRAGQAIAELIDPAGGEAMFAQLVLTIRDPLAQHYRMASLANQAVPRLQEVLEADRLEDVLEHLHDILKREQAVNQVRREIADRAGAGIEQQQREALLRQQKATIEEALGEGEDDEVAELRTRLDDLELPEVVRVEADRELKRLGRMNAQAPDYQMTRSYLELVADLPWTARTDDDLNLDHAQSVLDEDHHGLEEVKSRILEHLAIMCMNPEARAPILCLVGPPGVGKTSVGQSIARALGRQFERLAVGGLHDEAELRGHRRTYIGAMPGRILQAIRRAEVANPLLMLDEIDKLGRDFRGDPSAALMEILDPAQNESFRDNYLNLPFDLSKVFFVTTANSLDGIPRPLLDRMEIIRLSGYSDVEKVAIAERYLLPRQRAAAGLSAEHLQIEESVLTRIVSGYTREAGVRELERRLGRIARRTARRLLTEPENSSSVRAEDLKELLGPERFFPEQARRQSVAGVAAGLAWTEAGGDVLYVEAAKVPREDKVVLTGQLGDVMQESARAARSWLWSQADALGIARDLLTETGIHVHVPAGAVPKDGPSAGVTMATALASLFTGRPVAEGLAMTGEITLTGLVLPVGGIKEKVLAAHRAGMRRVLLPKQNENDLDDVPISVREELEFVFAEQVETVLNEALTAA